MPERQFRIVIDTNTLLRGLVSATSAAAKVRRAAEKRLFIPLLSKPVLDEYRRDPRDEKFLDLAISLKARHIISSGKDLLSLPHERNEAARRFRQRLPGVQVIEAGDFMRKYGADLQVIESRTSSIPPQEQDGVEVGFGLSHPLLGLWRHTARSPSPERAGKYAPQRAELIRQKP